MLHKFRENSTKETYPLIRTEICLTEMFDEMNSADAKTALKLSVLGVPIVAPTNNIEKLIKRIIAVIDLHDSDIAIAFAGRSWVKGIYYHANLKEYTMFNTYNSGSTDFSTTRFVKDENIIQNLFASLKFTYRDTSKRFDYIFGLELLIFSPNNEHAKKLHTLISNYIKIKFIPAWESDERQTVAHLAAKFGHIELLKENKHYLTHWLKRDKFGNSPLSIAIQYDRMDIIAEFLFYIKKNQIGLLGAALYEVVMNQLEYNNGLTLNLRESDKYLDSHSNIKVIDLNRLDVLNLSELHFCQLLHQVVQNRNFELYSLLIQTPQIKQINILHRIEGLNLFEVIKKYIHSNNRNDYLTLALSLYVEKLRDNKKLIPDQELMLMKEYKEMVEKLISKNLEALKEVKLLGTNLNRYILIQRGLFKPNLNRNKGVLKLINEDIELCSRNQTNNTI